MTKSAASRSSAIFAASRSQRKPAVPLRPTPATPNSFSQTAISEKRIPFRSARHAR